MFRFIAIVTVDQTIIVFDINRNLLIRTKLDTTDKNEKFTSIEWLLDDLIIALYSPTGRVVLYDAALSRIDSSYATRFEIPFISMTSYLNEKLARNNEFRLLASSRTIAFDSVWSCFSFAKGPIGVYRLRLPQNFNNIALMTHYLKISQIDSLHDRYMGAAVRWMGQLDWDRDGYATLSCFYKLMSFLLSMDPVNGNKT